ncbi:hypothetical protein C1H46_012463 [Malus baccata]|uniref:Uncharacterized protein n=1 Tax=Malus baccata TaxID=106549 RepID=A0A540MSS0_MALBA|nr:hypothetical protein C1H46_012463 [Malus baccata]
MLKYGHGHTELNRYGEPSVSCSQPENGFLNSISLLSSEKAVQELFHQSPFQSTDDHLIEFSDAMRTVEKALRRAAEWKASAQAEAAEWKRKYELERARNLHLEHKGDNFYEKLRSSWALSSLCNAMGMIGFMLPCVFCLEICKQPDREVSEEQSSKENNCIDERTENLGSQSNEQSEQCCGRNGICSHEVLRDETYSDSKAFLNIYTRKASFKLSWWCNGDESDQHKHDIVSFERGNITTAERSSKQIALKWESQPQTVIILTKPNSTSVRILCAEMVRWLSEQKKLNIYVEPRVRAELLTESSYFNFVHTWKDDSERYRDYLDSILNGPINITLRHRLQCHVIREAAKNKYETEGPMLVLNEVTIDRGISSYLTNLECYCDNSFVTCVQGDGLILSTTSGSTAYSLAAGGSMVHPQVPGILFTPICPHSLSFRPLILPEHVTLRVQVPSNSRSHAWASFDGKDRKRLAAGDALVCSMAPWPVPTACQVDSTSDFLNSIHDGLHWNLRKTQSFDGPRDA